MGAAAAVARVLVARTARARSSRSRPPADTRVVCAWFPPVSKQVLVSEMDRQGLTLVPNTSPTSITKDEKTGEHHPDAISTSAHPPRATVTRAGGGAVDIRARRAVRAVSAPSPPPPSQTSRVAACADVNLPLPGPRRLASG